MAQEVGLAYVRIVPSMQGFSGAVSKEMSGAGLDSSMGKAGDKAGSKFSASAKKAVGRGMVVAGAAVAGFAAKASSDFAGFQTQMLEVFTLLPGITKTEMGKMSGDVKSFAKEFGVLPDKVVPALYQAISAGVPQDNVFSFLETAQKAAKGGVTDLETAVDGISSVVNAYGADTIDAAKASDLLFTAVKLGKTNFEQLSSQIYDVVPAASAVGVGFGEVTAAIAALTAQGTPTRVATTQIRQAIVELTKGGSSASDTFKGIAGKTFPQFVKAGGTLQQALQMMEKDSKKSGKSMIDMFGSVEAGQAALALTGKGTEKFSAALAEMDASAGATDAAFATMSSGISAKIDKMKAKAAVFSLNVGEKISAVGPQWITLGLTMAGKSTLMTTAFSAVGGAAGKLASKVVLGTGKATLAVAKWSAQTVAAAAKATASVVATAARQVAAWAMIAARAMANAARIAAAWLISMGPIAIVAAAVAGLTIVVVKNWDKIRSFITGAATKVLNFIKAKWPLLLGILTGPFGLAVVAIAKNWDKIVSTAKAIPGKIKNAFKGMAALLINAGKDLIMGFINGIKSKLNAVKDTLGGLTSSLTSWKGPPAKDRKLLKSAGITIIDGFVDGLKSRYPAVKSSLQGLTDQLKAKIDSAKSLGKEIQGAFTSDLSATEMGMDGVAGDGLLKRLDAQAAQAEQFAATVQQLRKAGLRGDLLAQIVSQGPGSLDVARELAANVGLANKMAARMKQAGKSLAFSEVLAREGVNLKGGKVAVSGGGLFSDSQMGALGSGGGSGSAPMNVIIQPVSDSKKFMAWLRYEIRAQTGGNVQKALGQGAA